VISIPSSAISQPFRDLIDLRAGEQHCFDRTSARAIARTQGLRLANLLGKIGGGVDQQPVFAVGGDGKLA
jgi:hypothetical protein